MAHHYTISGTKLFVTDAHVADYIIVAAKTKGGVTLFLVDAKSPGVSCTLLPAMFGERQCEVKFDNVKLTRSDMLGGLNRGKDYLDRVMHRAAVAKCAEVLGGLEYVLEISVQYAKDRVAFGKAIGSYQAIQHHCANMLNDLDCYPLHDPPGSVAGQRGPAVRPGGVPGQGLDGPGLPPDHRAGPRDSRGHGIPARS